MEIKYSLSNDTWGEEEVQAVNEIISSRYFTLGKYVSQYEKEFALKFGAKYAVMSNSGSSANLLAIAALVYSKRLQRGDEVIVPAVSWSTTYFPLAQYGLKLRFVDIDINTLNINLTNLENAISNETKAIFAVNLLGNPNDFTLLQEICTRNNIILLEDNCESMGAEFDGKCAGSFGLMGTFSSYFSHHICTMEGGMTITNDEELYHYMLSIRSHGWTRHLPKDSKIYHKLDNEFYESFNFIMPGYNLRPLEMEAAIGIQQLKKLDSFVASRRDNAGYFSSLMKDEKNIMIQQEVGKSSWFGFAIILKDELEYKRDLFIKAFKENGIEVRPIVTGNFVKQKALEFMEYSISGKLDNADYIHENGFFVGNHSISMKSNIDTLIKVIKQVK
jgi:CDP-6-deoxy-D-xylo-4-hexulose-3-dehydrase